MDFNNIITEGRVNDNGLENLKKLIEQNNRLVEENKKFYNSFGFTYPHKKYRKIFNSILFNDKLSYNLNFHKTKEDIINEINKENEEKIKLLEEKISMISSTHNKNLKKIKNIVNTNNIFKLRRKLNKFFRFLND